MSETKASSDLNYRSHVVPVGTEAFNPNDTLGPVFVFGSKVRNDIHGQLITADMSLSTEQTSQLTLSFMDPELKRLKTGAFMTNTPVNFEDFQMNVGTLQIDENEGNEQVTLQCRSKVISDLKDRQGRFVMRHASPSDFIIHECKAVGANYVVEDTAQRLQIMRDVRTRHWMPGTPLPSSWTTFQRLASETGRLVFESAGTVYFGRPTWLLQQAQQNDEVIHVNWRTGDRTLWPINVPSCSVTDDGRTIANITVTLPLHRWRECRVGKALKMEGVPGFEDYYLVTQVDYSLLGIGLITLTAATPVNPLRANQFRTSGITGNSIRALLQYVGFQGEHLEVAIAVVMAESGGDATRIGDVALENYKWGPSVGLFQIRSLKDPRAYGPPDNKRIASKLTDAIYNARLAYVLSKGGTDWHDWSTFNSGAYRQFYRTGKNYTIKNWTVPDALKPNMAGDPRHGTKSALDFVQFCLNQIGDQYIYGYQTSMTNPNPKAFDCSLLVEWAAYQVGINLPRTSGQQYSVCKQIPIEEAVATRGALLFVGPGGSEHVAVSLGNGMTVEAADPSYGVCSLSATHRSFQWSGAGLIPGMIYS